MWGVAGFMAFMWSTYESASCLVTSTHVDVRVCSCKNPYVGVATFAVQHASYNFTLDVSCESTYDDAWGKAASVYTIGKTYDCLYNGHSIMWQHYQSNVLFGWVMFSIVVTAVYILCIIVAMMCTL